MGNVGIGDSSPDQALAVTGNINSTGWINATDDICIRGGNCLSSAGGGSMTSFTLSGDGGADQTISDSNTLDIVGGDGINTSGVATDQLVVGITADSVTAHLLADTLALDAALSITGQDVNIDANTLVVDASADSVGIGTTTPASALHVIGNINGSGYVNASTDLCIIGGTCLSSAGAGSVGGSGASPRIAYWTGATDLGSTSGFEFDGTDMTIPGGHQHTCSILYWKWRN